MFCCQHFEVVYIFMSFFFFLNEARAGSLFSKLCFDSAKADVITGEQIRLRNALEATESGLFDFFLCPFDFLVRLLFKG